MKRNEEHPSWEDFTKHEKRIAQLEKEVAQLLRTVAGQIGQTESQTGHGPTSENQEPAAHSQAPIKQRKGDNMSPALQKIVLLMRNGDMDAAFSEFQALSKDELIKQPVTAATLAAAMCVTRGDFEAGIKALEQVQQLTDDPRIEQIKQKLLKQAAGHKG